MSQTYRRSTRATYFRPRKGRRRHPALLGAAVLGAAVLAVGTVLITHNAGQAKAAAGPANPNVNCTLIVPANPLSAQGLATPYQLVATDPAAGPCNEANAGQSAFVEAAILGPDGQLTTYDPLVIDKGTQPAAPPVPAKVPQGATVGIWFGFNATNLTLQSARGTNALGQGRCVNGQGRSLFSQFAYCNAPAFFQSANDLIARHRLTVPPVGTAKDGLPCPTTRDFSVVDQDQSDNVVTHYLATPNGRTAQKDAANTAKLAGAVDLANGSDNLLLSQFMDPALGCTAWKLPDQSSDGQPTAALATDELSAAANQQAPVALVPLSDPMAQVNGNTSVSKANLYRQGVDQARIGGWATNGSGATYCTDLFANAAGIQRVFKDKTMFAAAPSVDAGMATNLYTFLAMRAQATYGNLNCQAVTKGTNPIALTTSAAGVVTAATFTLGGAPTTTTSAPATTTTSGGTAPTTTTGASSSGGAAPTTTTSMPAATTTSSRHRHYG